MLEPTSIGWIWSKRNGGATFRRRASCAAFLRRFNVGNCPAEQDNVIRWSVQSVKKGAVQKALHIGVGVWKYKTSYKTAIGFEQADRYLRLIVVAFEVGVCLVSSDVGGAVSAIIVDVVIPGYNVCDRAPEGG